MTVTIIRPNADENVQWTRVPASTGRFDKLNDDDDATSITNPGTGANNYQGISMGTVGLTGSQRIKAVRFRARMRLTGQGYVSINFISFGYLASKAAIVWQRSTASPIYPFSSAWFPKDSSGHEWVQGTLDSLLIRLFDGGVAAGRVQVYELYADVDVNNQPTLATPTVTGNTTSSRPTVAIVYSDADGDPQTAAQFRVFSAAQYGIGGFDASVSPNTYDSGIMPGDLATLTIPRDLVNAVTYKIYARAAQDLNGVRWWSDWVPSGAFTMGFEPVPAPSLTVVSDNTVPRVRNKITVDTKMNLLTSDDASFEAGIGSWANLGNTTIVPSATFAAKGAQSMRMTATAGGDMIVGTGTYPCAPNQAYTFLSQFRAAVTARSCRIEVRWNDGAGTQIGATVLGGNVTDSSANFLTQATLTATSPAGAASMGLRVRVLAAAAAEVHHNDANSYSTSPSTTWFAGGASQVDYELVEFTDLSPQHSIVINLLQPQLALGGEALTSAAGFNTRSALDAVAFDRSQAQFGEGSIRWDVGNAAGSLLDIGTPNGSYDPIYTPPAVPGTQYCPSYYLMAGSGTHSLRLVLTFIDQTGATVGSSTTGATNATIAQGFQRLFVTAVAPAGCVAQRTSVENINGDLVAYFIDGGQLEEGATPSPWHQGQGVAPAWQPVRGALTALVADQRTGVAVCYDREAAPGVIRLYRASTIVAYPSGTSGASPASAWVSTKLALLGDGTVTVLKDPNNPAHDMRIRAPSISEQIDEDADEMHPIRPAAVQGFGQRAVVSSDWISGVGGSITIQITDDHDWFRMLQLLETKGALLLQPPEGGQRYIRAVGQRSWTRTPIGVDGRMVRPSRYLRVVSLNFVEVDRPPVLA
jgi:hypothetical protein